MTIAARLNRAEAYRLADYIRAHYVTSGLGNPEFAAQANEALGWDKRINRDTIRNTLVDLGMQPNYPRRSPKEVADDAATDALSMRLQAVEDTLQALTARFNNLVSNLGGV